MKTGWMVDDGERNDLIRRITVGALGELAHWERPVSLPSIGPAFPKVFDRFEQEVSQLQAAIEVELALWSTDELRRIPPESEAPRLNPLFDEEGRLGSLAVVLRRLKSRVPQDFVGGWAVAGKEVDVPYWTAFTTVALEDLAFLSIGREPRKADLCAACATYGRSKEGDDLLYFLEDRLELIANAMGCDPKDQTAQVDLKTFFNWVEDARLPIDLAFHHGLRGRFKPDVLTTSGEARQQISDARVGTTKLDTRERTSLAKLITAMAIDAYGYNPSARRGPIPNEIEGIILRLGLEITADTIRKFLREGSQYLPDG
jgi:hypothetical protein